MTVLPAIMANRAQVLPLIATNFGCEHQWRLRPWRPSTPRWEQWTPPPYDYAATRRQRGL